MLKLRLAIMAALVAPLLASPIFIPSASALSCMSPDLGQAMENAKASDKLYYVLVGRFYHKAAKPAPFDYQNQFQSRPPTLTQAYFEGYALTPNPRTDTPLRRYPVTIETSCAGPWCGSAPGSGTEQIAFVEDRPGQAPILRIGACPDIMFALKREKRQTEMLRTCFNTPCPVESDSTYR